MSLVNDALKRARTEAQERQARESGMPLPPLAPERLSSSPTSKLLPILAMLGVVFLVGLLAGAITFVRNRAVEADARGSEPVAEAQRTAQAVPPTVSSAPPSTVHAPSNLDRRSTQAGVGESEAEASQQQRPVRSAQRPSSQPDRSEPTRTAAAASGAAIRQEPAAATPRPAAPSRNPVPQPTPPATTARSQPPTQSDDEALPGERDATSTDGRELALGGIAWSETGPFALINGRVLAAGERVEGFKVIDIQKDQVELEDRGERIVLRLR